MVIYGKWTEEIVGLPDINDFCTLLILNAVWVGNLLSEEIPKVFSVVNMDYNHCGVKMIQEFRFIIVSN